MSNSKRQNYNEFKYIIQKGIINKLPLLIAQNRDFKKPQTVYYGDADHPIPGQIDHWVS
nr:hypothetical protein [Mucilaginibacter sp. E4BP6]